MGRKDARGQPADGRISQIDVEDPWGDSFSLDSACPMPLDHAGSEFSLGTLVDSISVGIHVHQSLSRWFPKKIVAIWVSFLGDPLLAWL